jgi:F-box protein 21
MTTPQWRPALLSLPEEVLTTIVSCLTDQALVELTQVCKKLKRICSSPLEMQQRCMHYQWWEDRHEIEKKKSYRRTSDVNWRDLFFHRFRVQVLTVRLLSRIIENPIYHIVNFNKIAEFGYDAKDCLKAQAEVKDDEVDDPLARR